MSSLLEPWLPRQSIYIAKTEDLLTMTSSSEGEDKLVRARGRDERRLSLARRAIREEVIAADIFEPNFVDVGGGVTYPITIWLRRRAIDRNGISKYTFWMVTNEEVIIFKAVLTLRGWRLREKFGQWSRRNVKGHRIVDKDLGSAESAMEVKTPRGIVEIRALSPFSSQAKQVIHLICDTPSTVRN